MTYVYDDEFREKRNRFTSKPTFNSWWERHYHNRLDKGNMNIVKSFVRKYEFEKEYFM